MLIAKHHLLLLLLSLCLRRLSSTLREALRLRKAMSASSQAVAYSCRALMNQKQAIFVAFSSRVNYTDLPTAAAGEVMPTFAYVGVTWSARRFPTVVNLGFLDRIRYFFFQVAPQLSSRGCVDPVTDPLLLIKSGSAGNRTGDLWVCSQEL
jgi:hypothetical protein